MLHTQLSDDDVEQLLAGVPPKDHPDYAEVALVMRRLRAEGARECIPPMSPQLLAQLDRTEAELFSAQRPHPAAPHRAVPEVRGEREERTVRATHQRWRTLAAAAAFVLVVGIAVAGAQGAFSGDGSTPDIDASSTGADLGPEPTGGGTDGDADTVTADAPEVTDPPPPTTLPPTTAPPPETTAGDDADGDGHEGHDHEHWNGQWDWDDWEDGDWDGRGGRPELRWEPYPVRGGYENDIDGEGGMPPFFFEQRWWDACDGEPECLYRKWWREHRDEFDDHHDGPGSGPPGP